MKQAHGPRPLLKAAGGLAAGAGLEGLSRTGAPAAGTASGTPNADKLGWRLACQMYTFNHFSFYESLSKVASLGLRYIEGYAGQSLTEDEAETRTSSSMSAETRNQVKRRLADAGIRLASYYSVRLSSHESECRGEFEFAKEMGIEILACDPPRRAVDLLEKLADEYRVHVALHNHDFPSPYWNPESVLKLCKGRSSWIGICGDTGYWLRAGMKPVQIVKTLAPRLISLYLKDMNAPGRCIQEAGGNKRVHDVPFGTGAGDVRGVMEEIHRQGKKPLFVIEYTHNWDTSLPEIAQCVEYFDQVAAEWAGA